MLLISTLPTDAHWLPEAIWMHVFCVGVGAAAAVGAAEIATAAAAANRGATWVSLIRMAMSFEG